MLRLCVHSVSHSLVSCPENMLSIIRVDHFANHRHVNGTFMRTQPVDAIKLVGPSHAIRGEVPFIVPHVSDSLGFFKPGFAFLQSERQGLALFFCIAKLFSGSAPSTAQAN